MKGSRWGPCSTGRLENLHFSFILPRKPAGLEFSCRTLGPGAEVAGKLLSPQEPGDPVARGQQEEGGFRGVSGMTQRWEPLPHITECLKVMFWAGSNFQSAGWAPCRMPWVKMVKSNFSGVCTIAAVTAPLAGHVWIHEPSQQTRRAGVPQKDQKL